MFVTKNEVGAFIFWYMNAAQDRLFSEKIYCVILYVCVCLSACTHTYILVYSCIFIRSFERDKFHSFYLWRIEK